jgi:hypothetical protein
MSLMDYKLSLLVSREDPPFYALLFSAMRKADSANAVRLQIAFPEVWLELKARYDAPGGCLEGEESLNIPGANE